MPRVPDQVWEDYRAGTSFGSDFARLLGGGLYGLGAIQRKERDRAKDVALKEADDTRSEDHFNRSLAQSDEHFKKSRADQFALASMKYNEGADDEFDVTDPAHPIPVPHGRHPVEFARELGSQQMDDGGEDARPSTPDLPTWQGATDRSAYFAPRGSKTVNQILGKENMDLAARYDASPLGKAEAAARASASTATTEAPPAPSGRVIIKGKHLATYLANDRGIDKEARIGESAAQRVERQKRQEGESETAGRILTRAVTDPEYVPEPAEMDAISKDPRSVSIFGNLAARVQKRKDAIEKEKSLQAGFAETWKDLSDKVPPEMLHSITDKDGKPLPSEFIKSQVVSMQHYLATKQAQDFSAAQQEDRQRDAAERADYNEGKIDARTLAKNSLDRVTRAEARLAAAENQLRSTEVSEAQAVAFDPRAGLAFAQAKSQAVANVQRATDAVNEARRSQLVIDPKGPAAGRGRSAEIPDTFASKKEAEAWLKANSGGLSPEELAALEDEIAGRVRTKR